MVRLRLERFLSETVKKLHAHGTGPFRIIVKVGPNAYVLDLPSNWGISSTFNFAELVEYMKPITIPSDYFRPGTSFVSNLTTTFT